MSLFNTWFSFLLLATIMIMQCTEVRSGPVLKISRSMTKRSLVNQNIQRILKKDSSGQKRDTCGCNIGCYYSKAYSCITCCAQGLK